MNKAVLSFLFVFLLFGMVFHFPIVFAEDNKTTISATTATSDSNRNEGLNVHENKQEAEKNLLERRQKLEENAMERLKKLNQKILKIEEEGLRRQFREDGRTVNISREVSIDANGTKTIVVTRIITDKDGNVKTVVMTYTVGADGEKRFRFKNKNEAEGQNNQQGENEDEIHSNLNISTEFENNSDLEATTSDGEKHKLKVLPDEARQIIMERLKSLNITNLTLEEIKDRNIPRVIYNIESNKHGRFLGVFKLGLKVDSQVDPTTGEVIQVHRPWWGIFVIEQNESVPPATNGTTTNNVSA